MRGEKKNNLRLIKINQNWRADVIFKPRPARLTSARP